MRDEIQSLRDELIAWRRDFHRHPETAFQEQRTSHVVRAFLESLGIEVRACGRTGLRGLLRGGAAGPTVALRADMDALPVTEENEHEYRSQAQGAMHACGHDGHMAILMGTASVLAARRESLAGNVVFLFQPSEEQLPGGAKLMIEEGALEGVQRIFGLHLWQPLATGTVGIRPGPFMAQSDDIELVVHGKGVHASQPHFGVDPVLVASQIVVAAQSVVSRVVDPLQPAVVSFTTIHGGRTHNIIEGEVKLTGTVRTLDVEVQRRVKESLARVCEHTAQAFGATAAFTYMDGYPAVVNDKGMVDLVVSAATDEFGGKAVAVIDPVMGGEDFAYFAQAVPGAFVLFGAGTGHPYPHHNPRFDIDEGALPLGVQLMTRVAMEMLRAG